MALTIDQSPIPRYIPAPPVTEELDYVDLAIIDLSKLSSGSGKLELAGNVRDAMRAQGFLYVINHGLTLQETERMFDIANASFDSVSEDEKSAYAGKIQEEGSFQGYKPRQYWHIDAGVHDQIETYNINRDVSKKEHPQTLRPFLPEIQQFSRHSHFNVLHPILRLLTLGMDLPEETFVNLHGFNSIGESYVRFMKYFPRSDDEKSKTNNVWLKGHTDMGSITVLYSQPVAALQILAPDGKWLWIRHIPNALVINVGDALEYLSGGFYRATIHRVVQPPPSQRGYTRLGVYYFAMPDDNVKLISRSGSKSEWTEKKFEANVVPSMEVYRKARTSAYGRSTLRRATNEANVQEEVISGVVVRHYD
ncbi:Clavaminate synthase-like protein [Cristinia sonorae]|uniref:Clavaminate synthase-like protein n=1 Tax=Cristinia sonorae TaxID=1940300 RepID=A0A8K0UFI9_9AGAR|nr:Clavaminate synthase-like protein [Cristinia sonorae]